MSDLFDPSRNRSPGAGDAPLPDDMLADGPIPDELVDRLLDGEVDPEREAAVLRLIRGDHEASRRLDATERVLGVLRRADQELECPDFTRAILGKVAARSGLFSKTGFRRMLTYRYAAAAGVLLAVGTMFALERANPDLVRLAPQPAPVSRVVNAVPTGTADMLSGVRGVVDSIRSAVPAPAPQAFAFRRVVQMNREGALPWSSGVNPPMAAIMWVDEPVCRVKASCGDRPACGVSACESWGKGGWPVAGLGLPREPRPEGEAGVAYISFRR